MAPDFEPFQIYQQCHVILSRFAQVSKNTLKAVENSPLNIDPLQVFLYLSKPCSLSSSNYIFYCRPLLEAGQKTGIFTTVEAIHNRGRATQATRKI